MPATGRVRMELVELQLVPLVGPAEVHTFFEGPAMGDALDDDVNGLDEVHTEITSMNLSGMTSAGPSRSVCAQIFPQRVKSRSW